MAELNLTNVTEDEWKKFIKDIIAVQDKHNLMLVPTFKFNTVQGMTYEWGAIRKPPQNEVSKTEPKGNSGDTPAKK